MYAAWWSGQNAAFVISHCHVWAVGEHRSIYLLNQTKRNKKINQVPDTNLWITHSSIILILVQNCKYLWKICRATGMFLFWCHSLTSPRSSVTPSVIPTPPSLFSDPTGSEIAHFQMVKTWWRKKDIHFLFDFLIMILCWFHHSKVKIHCICWMLNPLPLWSPWAGYGLVWWRKVSCHLQWWIQNLS